MHGNKALNSYGIAIVQGWGEACKRAGQRYYRPTYCTMGSSSLCSTNHPGSTMFWKYLLSSLSWLSSHGPLYPDTPALHLPNVWTPGNKMWKTVLISVSIHGGLIRSANILWVLQYLLSFSGFNGRDHGNIFSIKRKKGFPNLSLTAKQLNTSTNVKQTNRSRMQST